MAKAKQLVQASGTAGATVKVNSDSTPVDKGYALYFRDMLNSLGYKARLQILSNAIQYPYVQNSKNKVEMAFSDWFSDYPGASDFLDILLGCDSFHPNSNASPNIAEFCNKTIQPKMTRALAQGATSPTAANQSWAKIDREVTDEAPWVAMFNPKYLDFVSKRVKNYTFSPQWYFLIDQASVK
jgi:peptide/nickel transport system substrate-binding protein